MGIIVAIMLFAAGVIFVNVLRPDVTTAENTDNLDCNNVNISDGAKLTCLGTGIVVPYFIIVFVSLAGGFIASRFMMG